MTDPAQLYTEELSKLNSLYREGPPSPIPLSYCRLRLAQLLINHGQLLKKTMDVAQPRRKAIDHTQKALLAAPFNKQYLRTQCYLIMAEAHSLLDTPPYLKLADFCEKAIKEIGMWYESEEGITASQSVVNDALDLEYLSYESKAFYLQHANAYKESIEIYQDLLTSNRLVRNNTQRFSLTMKLSTALSDTHRIKAAKSLLLDADLDNIATSADDRVRLHSARSLTYADSGNMRKALDEINAAMVHASDTDPERLGNLYIRAARFYISVDGHDFAKTLLPDYVMDESSWTGASFDLNRLVIHAQLDIALSSESTAKKTLVGLSDVLGQCQTGDPKNELPDYWWADQVLQAEYYLRFNQLGVLKSQLKALPELFDTTIGNHKLVQQPMLLIFAEAAPQLFPDANTDKLTAALISGSMVDDHWNQWRATLCIARKALHEKRFAPAVFWAKLSCSQVLSLSAPCLMHTEQRERITTRLMSPFEFLEKALRMSGRLADALKARAQRQQLIMAFMHAIPVPGELSASAQLDTLMGLTPVEERLMGNWTTVHDAMVDMYEEGIPFERAAAQSNLVEFIQTVSAVEEDAAEHTQLQIRQFSIPAGYAALRYWQNESKLTLTVETRDDIHHYRIDATLDKLRQQVYRFKLALAEHFHESKRWQSLAIQLYNVLVKPAKPHIDAAQFLIISATDAISALPFAALHTGSEWLLESHSVVYSHTGFTMRHSLSNRGAVFLGTSQHQSENLSELALSTEKELQYLKKAFSSTIELIDDQWTSEKLKSALQTRPAVVHFCCHFIYNPYRPSE